MLESVADRIVPSLPAAEFRRPLDRLAEVEHLTGLLSDPHERLVTVTGPAGVGKSHLAHAVVAELKESCGPVVVTDFAGIRDTEALWPGRGFRGPQQTAELVGTSPALFLLDNCDLYARQLLAGLATMLAECPQLTVLVTSRVSLDLRAERIVPIGPLATGPESAAVELLTETVHPYYRDRLTGAAGRRHVVEICAETEGVPLAIELAAEAIGLYGTAAVLQRIREGSYGECRRTRDTPTRHRSMANALAWGDPALSDDDRDLVRRLAVFESVIDLPAVQWLGGLDREAASAGADSLVRKSLLTSGTDGNGEPFFRIPRIVRNHYAGQLAADPVASGWARDSHAEYWITFAAAQQTPEGDGPVERQRALVAERLPDIRAAARHLRSQGDHHAVLRLYTGLEPWLLGHRQAPDVVEEIEQSARAVHASGADAQAVADAALLLARRMLLQGRTDGVHEMLQLADEAGETEALAVVAARTAGLRGELLRLQGKGGLSGAMLEAAATSLEHLGAASCAAQARASQALARAADASPDAEQPAVAALESWRAAAGGPAVEAMLLRALARVYRTQGRPCEAYDAAEASLRLLERGGEPYEILGSVTVIAGVSRAGTAQEQLAVARVLIGAEALRHHYGISSPDDSVTLCEVECMLDEELGQDALRGLRAEAGPPALRHLLTDALSLARPADAAAPVRTASPYGLTVRQYEISLLVTEGLTNRQIAGKLEISEWTVVNHLRLVMQKLGCSSRVQVARCMQSLAG